MNILADESVDAPIIEQLRLDGNSVEALSELPPHLLGMPDSAVLALSVQQQQLLLTADRDFGDIIMRDLSQAPAEGVVLYRLRDMPITQKVQRVAEAFSQYAARLPGNFSVIDQKGIRHRRLP